MNRIYGHVIRFLLHPSSFILYKSAVFDRLYVIHCKRLRERRVHLEPALRQMGWTAHWVEGHDPHEIEPAVWRERVSGRLKRGEVSVYLKHLAVYRDLAERGPAVGFVLEDDAVFPPGFLARFAEYRRALPADFELAFFGASGGAKVAPLSGNPLFGRETGSRSVSGYLLTAACAGRLLAELERRPIARPIDLTINDIVREQGLVVYWSVPALIENGTETGLFEHSLGVHWRQRGFGARLVQGVLARWRGWMERVRRRH